MMIMTIYLELRWDNANSLIHCWVFNYSGCYRLQITLYNSIPPLLASGEGTRYIGHIIEPFYPSHCNWTILWSKYQCNRKMIIWVITKLICDLIRHENSTLPLAVKKIEISFTEKKKYFVIIKSGDPQSNTHFIWLSS